MNTHNMSTRVHTLAESRKFTRERAHVSRTLALRPWVGVHILGHDAKELLAYTPEVERGIALRNITRWRVSQMNKRAGCVIIAL